METAMDALDLGVTEIFANLILEASRGLSSSRSSSPMRNDVDSNGTPRRERERRGSVIMRA
jgi:hypothetical protein